MNENIFDKLLEEAYILEYSQFYNPPEFKTSKKFNRAMERIFRLYEKNTYKIQVKGPRFETVSKRGFGSMRKTIIIALMIVFIALLAGCAAMYFISHSFRGDVYKDNTHLFLVNVTNCPQKIEKIYELTDVPDGFSIVEQYSDSAWIYCRYENVEGGIDIVFEQNIKKDYDAHIDTEYAEIEKIDLLGIEALCLDCSDKARDYCVIFWDNGDYVFSIAAHLSKKEVIKLAESVEINRKI